MKLDSEAPYIFTLDNVLSPGECTKWIEKIESLNPKLAPISTVNGEVFKSEYRNNERVMINSPEYALSLFERLEDKLPSSIFGSALVGLNELFRCYRYKPGMKFLPHSDGCYIRDSSERSYYTLLIYLNEVDAGGETAFFVDPEIKISPKSGSVLVFQHDITHEGCEVLSGIKYVVRTDVMYHRNA